ncbi:hypothetical protein M405DRAFT_806051, partial [Rhizopogon salebrosus TDB-379]
MLDSAPMPSGTEDQGREIESSAPLDYEGRLVCTVISLLTFVSFAYVNRAAIHWHPQEAQLVSIDSPPVSLRNLRPSKVPSSRLGRLFHYGVTGLAASLFYDAASEILRRSTTSDADIIQSVVVTEANITRLVSKLSQMRGAALKLGQLMSIPDTNIHPPGVDNLFRRVQDSAHYMPDLQMQQVHHAVLAASQSPSGDGGGGSQRIAVKIQFPNIASSIASDLGYVKMLLTAGSLLLRGLFFDRTIQVVKDELADECDYSREASFFKRYGAPECLGEDVRFKVPWVWPESTERVLVMEHMEG